MSLDPKAVDSSLLFAIYLIMALSKNFQFSFVPAVQAEAERRAVVMFGENWRADCTLGCDIYQAQGISQGGKTLAADALLLRAYENENVQDLSDGSPAEVDFYPAGVLRSTTHLRANKQNDPADGSPAHLAYHQNGRLAYAAHYQNGHLVDAADGSPAQINYSTSGEITNASSAETGPLSAAETIALLKSLQVRRVENLLAKADQSVIPAGRPLPENAKLFQNNRDRCR